MSGRVISWINSLFRAPFGYSPADSRTPSYSNYTGEGDRGTTGRDRHRGETPKSDTLQRPSRQIRDDALQMLEMLSVREWADDGMEGLYYVTWRHGDQFLDEIEKLWSKIASKPRNISPVSDFLIAKGIEDCDSNASAEISGAFATYFSVAKRVGLYLAARICVQRTIDHLVYQLAQLMLEDNMEPLRPSANRYGNGNFVLEFSPGPSVTKVSSIVDSQPHMSPLLVCGSLDGPLRNTSGNLSWRTLAVGGRSASGPLESYAS
ncbi:hypothetical protein T459_06761 [Capsicum annuum]|uniref:Cell morphogenesis central region domain-containing protein n=1 Tax=Capsicum annuum TaxID=4072 RepID=A0A2G3ABS9_CAPAN|nr:hypothetical protein T459_06761 [Capsicum annuum]